MLPTTIGHQHAYSISRQAIHHLDIATVQLLRLDRPAHTVELRPLAPIPFRLNAEGLGIEHRMDADPIIVIGLLADRD